MLQSDSLHYVKASNLDRESSIAAADILLLDTMGDLRALYRRANVAFIGGSLAPGRGGQSPAEPAMAGVPVLIGPYHEKPARQRQPNPRFGRRGDRQKFYRRSERMRALARR